MRGGAGGKNINLSIGFHHPDGDYVAGGLENCTEPGRLATVLTPEIVSAILVPGRGMLTPADNNSLLTVQLCRAINDWMADRWLGADARFRGSILAANQIPEAAGAENSPTCGGPAVCPGADGR